jgi:hypothetical protein
MADRQIRVNLKQTLAYLIVYILVDDEAAGGGAALAAGTHGTEHHGPQAPFRCRRFL